MKTPKLLLMFTICAYFLIGCEVGDADSPYAIQSSAMVTDPTSTDIGPVTIVGKEALMKRVAEKRRESPGFVAAMDGAYDGIAAGERSTVEAEKRPSARDSALEGAADDPDGTVNPVEGVVPFSSTRLSGGLRARIHGGVDPSDLDQPRESGDVDNSVPYEPKPFSF